MVDRWLLIRYRDFVDRSRLVVIEARGRVLVLDSAFDDRLDDYLPEYAVYELPARVLDSVGDDWTGLPRLGWLLGHILIREVSFDPTHRKAALEASLASSLAPT